VAVATWLLAGGTSGPLWAAGGLGLAAWLFVGTLVEFAERVRLGRCSLKETLQRCRNLPRSAFGMTITHAGLAMIIVGITGSTAWKTEIIQVMRPGDTVDVAGYQITLDGTKDNIPGPNYTALRASFTARKGGDLVAVMTPEKRMYTMPPRPTTDAAIHTNLLGDLYVVIGDPDGAGGFVARLYYNPLVPWIFIGTLVMVMGGVVSLTDRRYRVGAPLRRGKTAAAAARA
jgi:cytochrome c-type biogenesis protein CcmF